MKMHSCVGLESLSYEDFWKPIQELGIDISDEQVFLENVARRIYSLATYKLVRLSFPIEVSKEKQDFYKTPSNTALFIDKVKFIEGDGWGRYQILKGTQILTEFAKSKFIEESEAIIDPAFYMVEDVFSIKQIQGYGKLQIELLGWKLYPPGLMHPLLKMPE
jgi:hypothetical protein